MSSFLKMLQSSASGFFSLLATLCCCFEASKFLTQFVYLGSSTVYGVVGLDITILDAAKPLSCRAVYDCSHGLERPVYFPLACGFQDLAHISVKLRPH